MELELVRLPAFNEQMFKYHDPTTVFIHGPFVRLFEGDHRNFMQAQKDANEFRDAQTDRWITLIERTIERIEVEDVNPTYASLLRGYIECLREDALGEPIKTYSADRDVAVVSSIPLLNEQPPPDDVVRYQAWPRIGAILYWLSPRILAHNPKLKDSFDLILHDPRVLRGIADAGNPNHQLIGTAIADSRAATRAVSKANELTKEKLTELDTVVAKKITEIDAAISKAREDAIFKGASQLWSDKARRHTGAYLLGFVAILVSLSIVATTAKEYGPGFIKAMPVNETTHDISYIAILLVGLIFVALAWVFRMLGRFVLDNFTLASDARQRQMILQTFLNLVGTPDAKMQDGERVLILSAIFRPVAGQGPDDPAPSSLLDLMKGAFPGAGGEKKG